jgi:transcriptional regulator GlxA family with amidase domain
VSRRSTSSVRRVFDLANRLRKQKLYDIMTAAPIAEPGPTSLGFAFMPTCAMAALPLPVDTLLVSGGSDVDTGTRPEILDRIRDSAPRARRVGSIRTGAFALSAAGLLDGKRATTHRAQGAELARRHPGAAVEIDAIFIRDGNLDASAGISAGIDPALARVEEDHGRDFALSIARVLVLFLKRSGGQAQFSPQLHAQFSEVPAVRQAQLRCQENLAGDLRISTLCKIAGMSERDFVRKFRQDTRSDTGRVRHVAASESGLPIDRGNQDFTQRRGSKMRLRVGGRHAAGLHASNRCAPTAISRQFPGVRRSTRPLVVRR